MPQKLEQKTKTELTASQVDAFQKFSKLKVGALFMKMGTGKTRVAVEIVNYNNPDFLLYIAPFSTIDNVTAELEKWGIKCKYKVIGYETIASSDKKYIEILNELDKYETNFIIADESIFIKNGKTNRFNRCRILRQKCKYALILNGTPIVKNERDIYNQMQFLSEKIFGMNYWTFMNTFFTHTIKKVNGREAHIYNFYEENRAAFIKIIKPYIFDADLDFKKVVEMNYRFISYKSSEYEEVKHKILAKYINYDTNSFIELFNALNYVSATYIKKNEVVAEYIKDRQVICYCNYIDEIEQIAGLCDCYVITGQTQAKDRKAILEQFKNDKKPLLLTMGVGAYSLNLQFCNEIVYSSVSFNYGNYEQSKYRIKRLGQKNDIKYVHILSETGINNMIIDNLTSKKSLSDIINDALQNGQIEDLIKKL